MEKIVGKGTVKGGKLVYVVKWKGYPDSANTMEPLEHLVGLEQDIAEFEAEYAKQYPKSTQETRINPAAEAKKRKAALCEEDKDKPADSKRTKPSGSLLPPPHAALPNARCMHRND